MNNLLISVITLLANLYLYCIILRFFIERIRLDKTHPITRLIITITQPWLQYVEKVLPSRIAVSTRILVFLVVIELLKLLSISVLIGQWPHLVGLLGWGILDLINQLASLYIYMLFAHVLCTWLMPKQPSPISYMVYTLTHWLLTRIKRFIPTIKGIDLSVFVAILSLQLIISFIINPFTQTLMRWALS